MERGGRDGEKNGTSSPELLGPDGKGDSVADGKGDSSAAEDALPNLTDANDL